MCAGHWVLVGLFTGHVMLSDVSSVLDTPLLWLKLIAIDCGAAWTPTGFVKSTYKDF